MEENLFLITREKVEVGRRDLIGIMMILGLIGEEELEVTVPMVLETGVVLGKIGLVILAELLRGKVWEIFL
jgi:hydrogenase-4 membrane subunit HyfE